MLGPGLQAQKCWIRTGFWLPDLETHASGTRQFQWPLSACFSSFYRLLGPFCLLRPGRPSQRPPVRCSTWERISAS